MENIWHTTVLVINWRGITLGNGRGWLVGSGWNSMQILFLADYLRRRDLKFCPGRLYLFLILRKR
jgi:hypothetical protein